MLKRGINGEPTSAHNFLLSHQWYICFDFYVKPKRKNFSGMLFSQQRATEMTATENARRILPGAAILLQPVFPTRLEKWVLWIYQKPISRICPQPVLSGSICVAIQAPTRWGAVPLAMNPVLARFGLRFASMYIPSRCLFDRFADSLTVDGFAEPLRHR